MMDECDGMVVQTLWSLVVHPVALRETRRKVGCALSLFGHIYFTLVCTLKTRVAM